MVTIMVGADSTIFVIPKALICTVSQFFLTAFTGIYAEAETLQMTLDDFGVEEFQFLVDFIYNDAFEESAAYRAWHQIEEEWFTVL